MGFAGVMEGKVYWEPRMVVGKKLGMVVGENTQQGRGRDSGFGLMMLVFPYSDARG